MREYTKFNTCDSCGAVIQPELLLEEEQNYMVSFKVRAKNSDAVLDWLVSYLQEDADFAVTQISGFMIDEVE